MPFMRGSSSCKGEYANMVGKYVEEVQAAKAAKKAAAKQTRREERKREKEKYKQ